MSVLKTLQNSIENTNSTEYLIKLFSAFPVDIMRDCVLNGIIMINDKENSNNIQNIYYNCGNICNIIPDDTLLECLKYLSEWKLLKYCIVCKAFNIKIKQAIRVYKTDILWIYINNYISQLNYKFKRYNNDYYSHLQCQYNTNQTALYIDDPNIANKYCKLTNAIHFEGLNEMFISNNDWYRKVRCLSFNDINYNIFKVILCGIGNDIRIFENLEYIKLKNINFNSFDDFQDVFSAFKNQQSSAKFTTKLCLLNVKINGYDDNLFPSLMKLNILDNIRAINIDLSHIICENEILTKLDKLKHVRIVNMEANQVIIVPSTVESLIIDYSPNMNQFNVNDENASIDIESSPSLPHKLINDDLVCYQKRFSI